MGLHHYEEAAALAAMLPDDQRERFAAFLLDITDPRHVDRVRIDHTNGIRRWARDAGFAGK